MFIQLYKYLCLIISLPFFLVKNIAWFWRCPKCRNAIHCNNQKCKYRNHCFRYRGCITEEEAEKLLEFLDTLWD